MQPSCAGDAGPELTFSRRAFLGMSLAALTGCRRGGSRDALDILTWGKQGVRDGDFLKPRAVGVHQEEVYVIDTTGRVQIFSWDGAFARLWEVPDAENGTPTDIAFANDGRVLIPDTHYHRILEYTASGELLDQWGSYGSGDGEFVYPTGIVEGPEGAYIISEYGDNAERVRIFNPDHTLAAQWGDLGDAPGMFNRAMAVVLGRDNLVYTVDTANHRLQCFTLSGEFVRMIGEAGTEPGRLKFPYDAAVTPGGDLVVCEYGNHRLSRFTAAGAFMGAFGKPGRGPGEFNGPRGVDVSPAGDVFVADTDNHRVQRVPLEALA